MVVIFQERGIALVQVLIISFVLAALGLFILQTTRSQVQVASSIQQSFELRLELEKAEAQLLHSLLTLPSRQNKSSSNELVKNWNFYGKPFKFSQHTTVTIQDLNALISINSTNINMLERLFAQLGVDGHTVQTFSDSLVDWKDNDSQKSLNGAESSYYQELGLRGPRNGYLQSMEEVRFIKGAENIPTKVWEKYFTVMPTTSFNPLRAPKAVLGALVGQGEKLNRLVELRKDNRLTNTDFYQITGIDGDEFISFIPGETMRVNIEVANNGQRVSKSFIVVVRKVSAIRPVSITDVVWN
ncbi:type II secretory pathway, component PulK [Pseudoalteromonas sp. SW0106-04]|uniref:general secretion pathway protein GspK n=1 Tax=Pseudoalteromonas sp. SW0106-04 TaxID=1702169 RepID=UPI0006B65884|nr:type II secretion system protein GspK [Pseudoalteromonas sp. SW0106-04]GAP74602.1 type II secretory pathway, component PulK [Pseudoalteromonas sp. SW0106-04]